MPLNIQIRSGDAWQDIGQLEPKDKRWTIKDNKPGNGAVYAFECSRDDKDLSYSSLLRLKNGTGAEPPGKREFQPAGFETIKLLRWEIPTS